MRKQPADSLPEQTSQEHLGLERIVFFSDAVFAIAITLLALELRLPNIDGALTENGLVQALLSIWPKYLGFGIGFMTIGALWVNHHRKFRWIQRYDRNLMWLNLIFLLFIALLPFPTSIISEYGTRTATIFYAIVVALAALASFAVWWYASSRNRLISPDLEAQQRRYETQLSLVVIMIFVVSIGLAFIHADLAKFSWVLIAFAGRR